MPKNLYDHILTLAQKNPNKPALISCDHEGNITSTITYGALEKKLDDAAVYLAGLGPKKGDKIALAFGNGAELLILSWAAWASGIVTVPLDTKRDTPELYEYKIRTNSAKILIAQKGILTEELRAAVPNITTIEFDGVSSATNTVEWEKSLKHLALILFTSGTTGYPKGAMLSLENLIVNADGIREWFRISEDDVFLVNLPLHHINSTTFCLSAMLAGAAIAIPPAYSNSNFWRQVAKTSATFTSIVQSILFDQLSREAEYAEVKPRLKLTRIQIGSAPVVAHSVEEFLSKYKIHVYQGYGQTETALRVTGVPVGLAEKFYMQLVEENSIGVPMQWADLQIADEKGAFLGEGEEGELVVKGAANMEGYIGGEKAFRGDYFLTGDIGYFKIIDGQRYFYLKGRKREIIIKGGVNISPVAVENHLKKISSDVDQVYVIAAPDDRYGEEVAAAIVWKPARPDDSGRSGGKGIDEAIAKLRLKFTLLSGTKHISSYETPKYITSIKADDLPLTSTGKVQRTVLKDRLPISQFEPLTLLHKGAYVFSILTPQSHLVEDSRELYNRCWDPLTVSAETYKKSVRNQFVIIAADEAGRIAGQIAVIRTNLSEKELKTVTHTDLLSRGVARDGKALVCVSICSASFTPKPVPDAQRIPGSDEVEKYLPQDPVYKFHEKAKGGAVGAKLLSLIAGGRPNDGSSLGYTMLLLYPEPRDIVVTADAPVSNQLIEMVLLLAESMDMKHVYAYSRPGGLASYIARHAGSR